MSNTIAMEVGLPSVIGGSVKEMLVEISRDPAGDFESSESRSVDADDIDINIEIEANEGTHVTVAVRAIDDQGQSSKPVTKKFQANDPLRPELADNMTVEVITGAEAEAEGDSPADPPAAPEVFPSED